MAEAGTESEEGEVTHEAEAGAKTRAGEEAMPTTHPALLTQTHNRTTVTRNSVVVYTLRVVPTAPILQRTVAKKLSRPTKAKTCSGNHQKIGQQKWKKTPPLDHLPMRFGMPHLNVPRFQT